MHEQKLYKDLPSRGKFHSCIISSFSFDYHFFDAQIRRQLHSKGIYNIILLCDANILEHSFGAFSFGTNHFLNDYTITPIESKGAFHPKISIFFGEKDIMMHLGSGNLTSGGLGKNHELFSTLSTNSNDDPQFTIIQSGVAYLVSFLKGKTGFVQRQLKWIAQHCDLIQNFRPPDNVTNTDLNDGTLISFLANDEKSVYEQLNEIISFEEISQIKIVSPFFDDNGAFIKRLKDDFKNAKISILVQEGKTVLPSQVAVDGRIKYLDWQETERAKKKFKSGERFNHSKIFVFESPSDTYILHGSPNATSPAFGLHPNFRNEEAALLYHYRNPESVPDLGLSASTELDISLLKPANYLPKPETAVKYSKSLIKILGADKYLTHIHITFSKNIGDDQSLIFLDALGEKLDSVEGSIFNEKEANLEFKDYPNLKRAVALYVSQGDEKISKHAFINEVEYLWKCDPSRENRRFQKLLSNIQIGNIDEFDILSHLNSILREKNENSPAKSIALRVRTKSTSKKSQITYEQAKELEEIEGQEHHILSSSKSVWEALNILFKFIQTSKEEKSINQEEEGFKDDGGDIQEDRNQLYSKEKVFKDVQDFERMRIKLLNSFQKYLAYLEHLLEEEEYEIASPDLCYFLVLYYQLIHVAGKSYQLKIDKENSVSRVLLPLNGLIKVKDSFNSISLRLLGRFVLLTNKFRFKKYDDEYSIQEFETYKEQCSVLIYFALVLHASINTNKNTYWLSLLWMNTASSLYPYKSDSLHKLLESIENKVHFDLPDDLLDLIKGIEIQLSEIETSIDQPLSEKEFIRFPEFGACRIIRKIPSESPKSIKVSYPGIGFDEKKSDFIYPLLYHFGRSQFLKPTHK